ncbi:MAG: hypothetical protein HUK24_00425, partial [Sphaerochaetaceae bacterium]|nr:hypothetical protein [Sphaerochaetaceae bacterium]
MQKQAVLDADIVIMILSNTSKMLEYDGIKTFLRIFSSLEITPVIHSFVYNKELSKYKNQLDNLVSTGQIIVDDGIDDSFELNLYVPEFKHLYKEIFSCPFPSDAVFVQQKEGSMGEVHSILLARKRGIPLICSNDSSVSYYIKGRNLNSIINKVNYKLEIKNMVDLLFDMAKNG